jgi:hypothetical protein
MKFKSGQYIIDRQRWQKTYGGKKFKSTCALIILLKGDYDPQVDCHIPYVNWWTVDYKPHTKKVFKLKTLYRAYKDLCGGFLSAGGSWYPAPKLIIETCEKSLNELK